MRNHVIAERYAKALSSSIDDDGRLDTLLGTVRDLAETYAEHPELQTVLENPALATETREKIVDDVLALAGAPEVVEDFVKTLFRRGRIGMLPDVALMFNAIVDRRMNRVGAHVTVAAPLTPEQERRIREGLEAYSGKTVVITTRLDPDIIGGVVVRLDGAVIDGSLRARLERVKQTLLAEET